MPEVMTRGLRFHVQTVPSAGKTLPVGFVHGLVADNLSSFLHTLAGPLTTAGASCVLYDLRGHGLSERPATGYTVEDAVADLFGVLDAVGCHGPVRLVGNSFGGFIALRAALQRPDRVAGLVLIESHGPAERRAAWNEDLLGTLAANALLAEYERHHERVARLGWRRSARNMATIDALVNGTSLVDDLAAAAPVLPADLARVACPVLAVYGEHSDMVGAGRLLPRHVPDCAWHELPGLAHSVLLEGTAGVLEAMLPWLDR